MLNAFKSAQSIALVGAGSEIGRSIVRHLDTTATQNLFLVSRNGEADSPISHGAPFQIAGEFTTEAGRTQIVDSIFAKGDLDIAIIAIGVLHGELSEILTINYTASVELLNAIADRMVAQRHGTILVISSFAAVRPRPGIFQYGSAKAGLDFFAQGLAANIKSAGVKIAVLRPGFVHTKMTQGLTAAPFSIDVERCGKYGAAAITGKKVVTYAPGILKFVASVLIHLPQAIFNKITAE